MTMQQSGATPLLESGVVESRVVDSRIVDSGLDSSFPHDSAISRVLRPGRAAPADILRPTRAEVNLGALRHNLHVLRRRCEGTAIWAVLKADGYGHGSKAVARTLERSGAAGICVALVEEGVELREAGIVAPILVMGGYYERAYGELLRHRLTPVLQYPEQIEQLAEEVRFRGGDAMRAHLKADTGMARLGATMDELPALAEAWSQHPEVKLEGLMTHFACADDTDSDSLDDQLRRFREAEMVLAACGVRPTLRHAANSAAALRSAAARFDLVRPGIALFGIDPVGVTDELRPVMTVSSRVVSLRNLPVGASVGYGASWRAKRPSRIATIPLGYADGLSRALSNRGQVLVRGTRAPLVGVVSMDMSMIDVTDVPGVELGDDVVLLGKQTGALGTDVIGAGEIAEHTGTIAWEVLTNISRRVPRFYREP